MSTYRPVLVREDHRATVEAFAARLEAADRCGCRDDGDGERADDGRLGDRSGLSEVIVEAGP